MFPATVLVLVLGGVWLRSGLRPSSRLWSRVGSAAWVGLAVYLCAFLPLRYRSVLPAAALDSSYIVDVRPSGCAFLWPDQRATILDIVQTTNRRDRIYS